MAAPSTPVLGKSVFVKLDPFYLIVDFVEWLRRLLPQGVRLVQLRIKHGDEGFSRAN